MQDVYFFHGAVAAFHSLKETVSIVMISWSYQFFREFYGRNNLDSTYLFEKATFLDELPLASKILKGILFISSL